MPRSDAVPADVVDDDAEKTASGAGRVPEKSYPGSPRVIPRSEHGISRRQIDPNALKVLYRLSKAGFAAHLVGGGVRDLLLGGTPKDFDIATDAEPEEVRALFRNCRLIGRRFRLAHVVFGRDVVEVATFRAGHPVDDADGDDGVVHDDGRILRDNVFGTLEDDAYRRDFTINALYYDIDGFVVLDFADAMSDLAARRLRLIGDPATRFREDPVRMLRAARLAAKLGFDIDPATAAPMADLGPLLRDIPASRLFDEGLKLFQNGHAVASLRELVRLDLLQYLFPAADAALKSGDRLYRQLLERALANTDRRLAEGKTVTPAFFYAVFLWPALLDEASALVEQGESTVMAFQRGGARVAEQQQAYTSLPKRFAGPMREIWLLQAKLEMYQGRRARRLLEHPRLRAAWDFLCLRRDAGEAVADVCDWWQAAMAESGTDADQAANGGNRRPRRRSRGGRRRKSGDGAGTTDGNDGGTD